MQTITIRSGTLVILSGLPGSGKSRLRSLAVNLPEGAWVSSDAIREQILGTQLSLVEDGTIRRMRHESCSAAAFQILGLIVKERLSQGLTTVVDATNIDDQARSEWAKTAATFGAPVLVLIVDTPEATCLDNNRQRDFPVPDSAITERSGRLQRESKFDHLLISAQSALVFRPHELDNTAVDVIGDVHGLWEDLQVLLKKAGWALDEGRLVPPHPGRRLLFLGDLVDRGPESLAVVNFVKDAVSSGLAYAVKGNHEVKLVRFLESVDEGRSVANWTSYANAETGVAALKLAPAQTKGLVQFLRSLPAFYVHEASKVAFVHADLHHFEPSKVLAEACVYGDSRRRAGVDSDAEYEKRYACGLNQYTLFRGHIPQTSNQPHVFSLERNAVNRGELVLLQLDRFLAARQNGTPDRQAFEASLVTQRTSNGFVEYSAKAYGLLRGMRELQKQKLVTGQTDETGLLTVFKYSRSTFWSNSWSQDPNLLKARGLVLDAGGGIVSHPFDKLFNAGENGAGVGLADDLPVLGVEKLNGFLGLCSLHPFRRNELLLHTQGGFGGPFVEYIRTYLEAAPTRGALLRYLAKHDVTLMFEVLHPEDPHVIEYSPEQMGAWLIGVRSKGREDKPWTEEAVDRVARELGVRRPGWQRMTFGEARAAVQASRTEGLMLRADSKDQDFILKWKSPYYLVTKFLSRMTPARVAHLYKNPRDFRKTIDEEFYPLVDALRSACAQDEFVAMERDARAELIRALLRQTQA